MYLCVCMCVCISVFAYMCACVFIHVYVCIVCVCVVLFVRIRVCVRVLARVQPVVRPGLVSWSLCTARSPQDGRGCNIEVFSIYVLSIPRAPAPSGKTVAVHAG